MSALGLLSSPVGKLTAHQSRFLPERRGRDAIVRVLIPTITDEVAYRRLQAELVNIAHAISYRHAHHQTIVARLRDRNDAILTLKHNLKECRFRSRDIQKAIDTAHDAVQLDRNRARLDRIQTVLDQIWEDVKVLYADKIRQEAEGLEVGPRYFKPGNAFDTDRLQKLADDAGVGRTAEGWDGQDLLDLLIAEMAEVEKLRVQIEDWEKEVELIKTDARKSKEAYAKVQRLLDDEAKRNLDLKLRQDNNIANLKQQLSDHAVTISQRDVEIKRLEGRWEQDQASRSEAERKLQLRVAELEQEVEKLTGDVSDVNARRNDSEKELHELREEFVKYKKAAEAKEDFIRQQAGLNVTHHANQIEELRQQISTLEQNHKAKLDEAYSTRIEREERLVAFFHKSLRFIVYDTAPDWRNEDRAALEDFVPYFKTHDRYEDALPGPQSAFADRLALDPNKPHLNDFASLVVGCLDDKYFVAINHSLQHLHWLNDVVDSRFIQTDHLAIQTEELAVPENIMLTCLVSLLHNTIHGSTTDPDITHGLPSYWAATLLVRLRFQWDLGEPSVLIRDQQADTSTLPLLQAAGSVRLRMMARRTATRPLRLEDTKMTANQDDDAVVKIEDEEEEEVPILPNLTDGRFVKDIEEDTDLCALDTVDFLCAVCPNSIVGDSVGNWFIKVHQGEHFLVIVVHNGVPCCFVKTTDKKTRFTMNRGSLADYDNTTRVGHMAWRFDDGTEVMFEFHDQEALDRFVRAFHAQDFVRKIMRSIGGI